MRSGRLRPKEPGAQSSFLTYSISLQSGLVSTANLVRSIGRLLYAPVSLKGVEVLARTALEAAARSWWLLDPDIAPRERVTRGVGEALHGLRADARMLGKTGNRELVKSAQS